MTSKVRGKTHKWLKSIADRNLMDTRNTSVLATPGHRIGAYAVDMGLSIVTFGIGWFIWSLVLWNRGQTPAKSLLKLRVLDETNGNPAKWGHMIIRQFLIPWTMSLGFNIAYLTFIIVGITSGLNGLAITAMVLSFLITLGVYIVDFVWLFGEPGKRLVDYWSKTIVVNEANI